MDKNHNIKYCIALSKRIISLKKCILLLETNKTIVQSTAQKQFKQFNEMINSLRVEVIHIEHFIPRLLRKVYPQALLPERFYFSSFDIRSNVISIILHHENNDYQKFISLNDGSIFEPDEDG